MTTQRAEPPPSRREERDSTSTASTNASAANRPPERTGPPSENGYAHLPAVSGDWPQSTQVSAESISKVKAGSGRLTTKVDIPALAHGNEASGINVAKVIDAPMSLGLAWTSGVHAWTTNFNRVLPASAYDTRQYSNAGIGLGAVDTGYKYRDQDSGREFSATLSATYNFGNSDTIYRKGVDSHLDWTTSQLLGNWQLGMAGYANYRTSDERGTIAPPSPFKAKVAAIGPNVGYLFMIGGLAAYASFRGYWEFWSEDRVQGYGVTATLDIPLGARPRE